ncbi:hypothetical protein GCM10009133_31610 [Cocleimonas flava]|uniref:Uncharacterized protein n=1 Tax=Cocleimonas flava TaxID=634765 RepID=A0A4R1F8E9_9GAMM|nr:MULTISPECIES: hypothetical protein [Cocleimonas]MEB8431313.1 hypothetical protein [Cocleimonas sp. KMM 6892]MEC4713915.1 hypothetical protein [Cocleimonas sp. KMM 6895]MEC4743246.1 hypothetical protein [Cocleimonas sp. KMM 6896]TCJ88994.1 hypothetical protein EV695_0855 [Cocleimonas flava]
MNTHTINHNALTHLIEAGAVAKAKANAEGDTWTLTITAGETDKIVMAKNSGKARVWRKLDTLAKYLLDIGLGNFEINLSDYDPTKKSLRRPDSANTLKKTHEAHKSFQKQKEDKLVETTSRLSPSLAIKTQTPTPEFTNNTDRAIQTAKERWEERRAKILQKEDPRAK